MADTADTTKRRPGTCDDISKNNDSPSKSEGQNAVPQYSGTNGQCRWPGSPPVGETQYKNAREYAQTLHQWLWQYRVCSSMQAFHFQMLSLMSQTQTGQGGVPTANVAAGFQQNTTTAGQQPRRVATGLQANIPQAAGSTYKIPMLWKRVAAEVLDFILLFYIKILVTVAVLRQMGYMGEHSLDLDVQGHFPLFMEAEEIDYDKLFNFTSELIALEVVNRVCITIVETMCIRKGFAGSIGGATPGKKIMGLRVISFSEIRDQQNGYVTVMHPQDPGFIGALIRSVIKNFSMAFFFPACFTVFFFRFNRAAYDVLGQTLVVEVDRRVPL